MSEDKADQNTPIPAGDVAGEPETAEAPDAKSDTGTAPSAGRRLLRAWPAALLIVVVIAALGALAVFWPRLATPDNARLQALETKTDQLAAAGARTAQTIDTLRTDLDTLKGRVDDSRAQLTQLQNSTQAAIAQGGRADPRVDALETELGKTNDALNALGARIAKLESTVPADLDARLNGFAAKSDVATQGQRIAHLEEANSGIALKRAATVLAEAALARAASGPRPFADELAALASLAPDDPALTPLRPHADAGVPTAMMLAARFPAATRGALATEHRAPGTSWWARIWNSLTGLISIRRVGEVQGNDAASRLARAQTALDNGHLAAAVVETDAITGPAARALEPWLTQAHARVAVDDALADLDARATKALARPVPLNAPDAGSGK